jgi:hypothetical protein
VTSWPHRPLALYSGRSIEHLCSGKKPYMINRFERAAALTQCRGKTVAAVTHHGNMNLSGNPCRINRPEFPAKLVLYWATQRAPRVVQRC